MNTARLQLLNINKAAKEKVEEQVKAEGFGSLQEFLKYLITRTAKDTQGVRKIMAQLSEHNSTEEGISTTRIEYYIKLLDSMKKDVKTRKARIAKDGNDLVNQLMNEENS